MKAFVVHDAAGNILRSGVCADADLLLQAREGETAIEGTGTDTTHRVENGVLVDYTPPPPVLTEADFSRAVQRHLDATARARGYDNIFTAATYADEPSVPQFQAEGQALRAWRSAVWAACHVVLSAVQAQEREIPTIAELLAELPAAPVFD